jgi:hypothetical protein
MRRSGHSALTVADLEELMRVLGGDHDESSTTSTA